MPHEDDNGVGAVKILIAAIGKARASPEHQIYLDYTKRLPWKIECREACKGYDRLVTLDEGGKLLGSREFAQNLGSWQQEGFSSFAFVIGGSDGLSEAVLNKAQLRWSLGRVTWPHMLVRGLLAEQLYRAHTVLTGHPYHRD
jgi:23S rRNA (pseudouridine1915-N3)-methyltransferase